jgi:hypothetical protein
MPLDVRERSKSVAELRASSDSRLRTHKRIVASLHRLDAPDEFERAQAQEQIRLAREGGPSRLSQEPKVSPPTPSSATPSKAKGKGALPQGDEAPKKTPKKRASATTLEPPVRNNLTPAPRAGSPMEKSFHRRSREWRGRKLQARVLEQSAGAESEGGEDETAEGRAEKGGFVGGRRNPLNFKYAPPTVFGLTARKKRDASERKDAAFVEEK